MSEIVPFQPGQVPAYIRKAAQVDDELTQGVTGGFAILSIQGKCFSVVKDGERRVIPNPKDPDTAATYVDLVLVRANPHISKTYYARNFDPNEQAGPPDCFSINGDKPDPASPQPQAKTCAACPHNQWGSRITDSGKKAKACQDNRRVAVASPKRLDEPMLLRVPPTSLPRLKAYGDQLRGQGIPYYAVLTRIMLDQNVVHPSLTFKPLAFLSEEQVREVEKARESEAVLNIIGSAPEVSMPSQPTSEEQLVEESEQPVDLADALEAAEAETPQESAQEAQETKPKPKATKARSKAPEPAPKAADEETEDLLADINEVFNGVF